MRFLRFILLFSCFSLLMHSNLFGKTAVNCSTVQTEKKEKAESTCIPSPDSKADAILSRLPQINFTFFKSSRQNQFSAVQTMSAELLSQTENFSGSEIIFSAVPIRRHLIFCVMRC